MTTRKDKPDKTLVADVKATIDNLNKLRDQLKSTIAAKSVPIPKIKSLLENAALGFKGAETINKTAGGSVQSVG